MTAVARSESLFLSTLPGKYYYDAAIYELELERIFSSMWVCAGRANSLRKPGVYQPVTIGRESVIVCRNKDGMLQAFLNGCRPRGARLSSEALGQLKCEIQSRSNTYPFELDARLT